MTGIANQLATAIENGKLQEECQRTFRKIGEVVEELSDAALRVDGRMKVTDISSNAEKFLGWKAKDLRGEAWSNILKPKDLKGRLLEEMDFVGRVPLMNGELSRGQKAFIVKGNGSKIFCYIRALPMRGRSGQPSQLLFVFKKAPIPKKVQKEAREGAMEAKAR